MTTTVAPSTATARTAGRRRRIAAVVLVVILGGGLTAFFTWRHLDHQYGPVESGGFWGPQSDHGLTVTKSGYRLADRPGATARFVTALDNRGAHSVRITSIDAGDVASDIRWSVYRTIPGGFVSGVPTPWHDFPALVPARGTIRVLITIHHPADCAAFPKVGGVSTAVYSGEHDVHWDSLLHSNTTTVRFYVGSGGIRVC